MSPVSVVIATRDRAQELTRTLAQLQALPERPPIIVVDNGSTDDTPARVARDHPHVEVVELGAEHGAAARTEGGRRAATPYVAFSDDDSWWAPGALARAAAHFDRCPQLGLLAARILVGPQRRLDPVSALMARTPADPAAATGDGAHRALPGPSVLGFLACGAVVRGEAFLSVGGFEPGLGFGGEEQPLALDMAAAGWHLAYADDVVAHHHPSTLRDSERRRRAIARNDLWTAWTRRRPKAALARTLTTARSGLRDPATARGVVDAMAWLPAAMRSRRPVPCHVEAFAAALDATSETP